MLYGTDDPTTVGNVRGYARDTARLAWGDTPVKTRRVKVRFSVFALRGLEHIGDMSVVTRRSTRDTDAVHYNVNKLKTERRNAGRH